MVHRSTAKLLHVELSSDRTITFSWSRLTPLVSRATVRLQESLSLLTLLPLESVKLMAYFGSLRGSMYRTCPHHIYGHIFITPITDGWPVLYIRSSPLTCFDLFVVHNFLEHLLSNLLTLFSISLRPFHDSHPYINSETIQFRGKVANCAFQTLWNILNDAPTFPFLIPT